MRYGAGDRAPVARELVLSQQTEVEPRCLG